MGKSNHSLAKAEKAAKAVTEAQKGEVSAGDATLQVENVAGAPNEESTPAETPAESQKVARATQEVATPAEAPAEAEKAAETLKEEVVLNSRQGAGRCKEISWVTEGADKFSRGTGRSRPGIRGIEGRGNSS